MSPRPGEVWLADRGLAVSLKWRRTVRRMKKRENATVKIVAAAVLSGRF
jgi:hypothetical protein